MRTASDDTELRQLLEAGSVVRRGHGIYALPGVPDVVVAARRTGGWATCVSALALADLPLVQSAPGPHVCVPRNRGAPRAGLLPPRTVLHWEAAAPAGGRSVQDRVVVPLATALVHALRCLPLREVVAAADAALHRGLVRDVSDIARLAPRGGIAVERLVRMVDGRSESLPESLLRVALRARGLRVRTQVLVEGVGRVDLLVEEAVLVEVDGYAYHSDRRAFQEDRRRDRVAGFRGLRVLRFTYAEVVHDTTRVVMEVEAVARATARGVSHIQDVRRR